MNSTQEERRMGYLLGTLLWITQFLVLNLSARNTGTSTGRAGKIEESFIQEHQFFIS